MIVAGTVQRLVHTPPVTSLDVLSELVSRTATLVRQRLCGLRGHIYVLHSSPERLSLRCFACRAETRGWAIEVRPAFDAWVSKRARVAPRGGASESARHLKGERAAA
jgi:hypothetical protein